MASTFKPTLSSGYDNGVDVRNFDCDPSATFKLGEFVYFDVATQTLKGCGADPALIAGIALSSAASALGTDWPGNIIGGTKVPVACIGIGTDVFMSSATTPDSTHIGVDYGIVSSSGTWKLDTGDTANKRAKVVGISNSPQQEGFIVRMDPKYLQFIGTLS